MITIQKLLQDIQETFFPKPPPVGTLWRSRDANVVGTFEVVDHYHGLLDYRRVDTDEYSPCTIVSTRTFLAQFKPCVHEVPFVAPEPVQPATGSGPGAYWRRS